MQGAARHKLGLLVTALVWAETSAYLLKSPNRFRTSHLLALFPSPPQLLAKVGVQEAQARPHVASVVGNPHYINFEEFCNLLGKLSSGPSEAEILQEMFQARNHAS